VQLRESRLLSPAGHLIAVFRAQPLARVVSCYWEAPDSAQTFPSLRKWAILIDWRIEIKPVL